MPNPNIYLYGGEATPNNIRLRQLPVDSPALTGLAGTLTALGLAAILSLGIIPPAGALTLDGYAPLKYPTGLNFVGYAPTVLQNNPLASTTAALTLTGQASVIGNSIIPTAGSLALTGQASTLQFAMPGQPGALVLTGAIPTALISNQCQPDVGSLIFSGKIPTVTATGGGGPSTALFQRVIRGNDETGKDDWWVSYQA